MAAFVPSTRIAPENGTRPPLVPTTSIGFPRTFPSPQLIGIMGERVAQKNQVDEYQDEMIQHLLEMELLGRPNLDLMQSQPEVTLRMRPLLLDFLMDVNNKLNLSKLTYPLTVNMIDRYASVCVIKKKHYQLLGLTALWVACKNMDAKGMIPRLDDLCRYCCGCYDRTMFLEMERHLMKSLKWHINTPTTDNFLNVFLYRLSTYRFVAGSKMTHSQCTTIEILANYFCELASFYPHIHFSYLVPQIALIATIMSCMIMEICTHDELYAVLGYMLQVIPATAEPSCENEQGASKGWLEKPVLLTLHQMEYAYQTLAQVATRPPPSLKTKYFSDHPHSLNLSAILMPFNASNSRMLPLQLPTSVETLTPTPLVENSPVRTPSFETAMQVPTTQIVGDVSNIGDVNVELAQELSQVRAQQVQSVKRPPREVPTEAESMVAPVTKAGYSSKSLPRPLTRILVKPLSAAESVIHDNNGVSYPLPLLLPGQEKRKAELEQVDLKRAKIAA